MGDEVEVRREDQDKINKFSRLHQHELSIEEELKTKNVGMRGKFQLGQSTANSRRRKRRKNSMISRASWSLPTKTILYREPLPTSKTTKDNLV